MKEMSTTGPALQQSSCPIVGTRESFPLWCQALQNKGTTLLTSSTGYHVYSKEFQG